MTVIINGTTGITDVNGTAAAPALTGTDTDTGIFFPAANTLAFSTNGTEDARFDSAGNFGLGVTPSTSWASDPSATRAIQLNGGSIWSYSTTQFNLLQNAVWNGSNNLYVNTAAASAYRQISGVHSWYNAPSGTAGNAITFTQAMTLDASGRLGIGTTSPGTQLHIANNTTPPIIRLQTDSGGLGGLAWLYTSSGSNKGTLTLDINAAEMRMSAGESGNTYFQTFYTNGSERARIDSSGNLLVGTTTVGETTSVGVRARPDGVLRSTRVDTVNTASTLDVYSTGASAYRFYVGMAGTVYATSTTITAISDQRFKENIRDLDDGLDVVMALKPRKFDWKEGKGQNIKDARGFIAQEFEQVLPDMVEEWRDPAPEGEEPYKAVNANLIPTLVKAIQEQQAIITQLQADVAALKGQA